MPIRDVGFRARVVLAPVLRKAGYADPAFLGAAPSAGRLRSRGWSRQSAGRYSWFSQVDDRCYRFVVERRREFGCGSVEAQERMANANYQNEPSTLLFVCQICAIGNVVKRFQTR
jgi:hypothetical protein